MKKLGILLFTQSLLVLAVLIGLATIAQACDKASGSFFFSVYAYISMWQWILVIIPALFGILLFIWDVINTWQNKQEQDGKK